MAEDFRPAAQEQEYHPDGLSSPSRSLACLVGPGDDPDQVTVRLAQAMEVFGNPKVDMECIGHAVVEADVDQVGHLHLPSVYPARLGHLAP